MFYLKNTDVLLCSQLEMWNIRGTGEIQAGLVLFLIVAKFGMTGYNKLDSKFLDSILNHNAKGIYKSNWREAYTNICRQNSYTSELKQTKPSNLKTKFKTCSNATCQKSLEDEELIQEVEKTVKKSKKTMN